MKSMFRWKEGGPLVSYFMHEHNCGTHTSRRRTERTVELAIANYWLAVQAVAPNETPGMPPLVTEIGAVTPYYWPNKIKFVVDPTDPRGTFKQSLFACNFLNCDVLSVSTLEHIGDGSYGLKERRTPLEALQKIATEANRFLITFPYGFRKDAAFLKFQEYALQGDGFQVFTLTRNSDETWSPSDTYLPYNKDNKPWANTVVILERGGLL